MFVSLARRHRVPELMDQPGLDASAHAWALDGLERINRISRSSAILWPAIARLASRQSNRPIRVLDVAAGGGDVPIAVAKTAARRGLDIRVDGCDLSAVAVDLASRKAAEAGVTVRFFRLDALADSLPEGYNIMTCSLFLHHLTEDDAVRLLSKMAGAAQDLLLVNDLRRTQIGYGAAWTGCRLLSGSPIVHHDGPASVRAAFSLAEASELARCAGLVDAQVSRRWPWRFLLTWSRQTS